ncbi:MAG: adenosylcobinamide-phosphate synthase CbiB [Dethiobacteria bacterium]|jgi:adenosylcobinamide-phosphate synthase
MEMGWFQTNAVLILLAYCLDLALGDPRRLPHPVVLMGRFISFLERRLRVWCKGAFLERTAGIFLVSVVVGAVFFLSREIISRLGAWNAYWGYLVAVYLFYTTFSLRSLEEHILAVELPLKKGDLPKARRALAMIVGRDTEHLTESEISRAALESLAENTSDGVIAPLFFAFIGGAPLAMAYKAVNTLDSMLGYRNDRYFYFGWAAARLDDLVNLVPARLTSLFILAAALIGGKLSPLRVREYCGTLLREGKKHLSPNSGYPEAAAALLLHVRLGGKSFYQGVSSDRPVINAPGRRSSGGDLETLRILVKGAAVLALITGMGLCFLASIF